MSSVLNPKVVLVTGASSGIGRATALALSKAGATVAVGGRRTDRLEALAQEAPGEILVLDMDVSDPESVRKAVDRTVERFGTLDIVVNNAGIMLTGPVLDANPRNGPAWWRPTCWAPCTRCTPRSPTCCAPRRGGPDLLHLGPHLLGRRRGLLRHQVRRQRLRRGTAPRGDRAGVRVVVVEPGFVSTELADHITDPTGRAAVKTMAESMRTLQPEDIAAAVVYAVTQPDHVAVNEILVRPTDQSR